MNPRPKPAADEQYKRDRTIARMVFVKRDKILQWTLANVTTRMESAKNDTKIGGPYLRLFELDKRNLTPRLKRAIARLFKVPENWADQPLADIARLLELPDDWEQMYDDRAAEQQEQEDPEVWALVQQLSDLVEDLVAAAKRLREQPPK